MRPTRLARESHPTLAGKDDHSVSWVTAVVVDDGRLQTLSWYWNSEDASELHQEDGFGADYVYSCL